jgi:hypothetical protein
MAQSTIILPTFVFTLLILLSLLQVIILIGTLLFLKSSGKERQALVLELRQTLARMEILTAADRAPFIAHIQKTFEALCLTLPAKLGRAAGDAIFEVEKKMLATLSSIEPNILNKNEQAGELISAMESLEDTILKSVVDSTENLLKESRDKLLSPELTLTVQKTAA